VSRVLELQITSKFGAKKVILGMIRTNFLFLHVLNFCGSLNSIFCSDFFGLLKMTWASRRKNYLVRWLTHKAEHKMVFALLLKYYAAWNISRFGHHKNPFNWGDFCSEDRVLRRQEAVLKKAWKITGWCHVTSDSSFFGNCSFIFSAHILKKELCLNIIIEWSKSDIYLRV
jgi:hypothetical protein